LRRGGGNLWHVTATFNGKHAQDMAIDTGASIIALPYSVAAAAGLTPSSQDPTMHVTLADGHQVEAKQIFASSVRVGQFTVDHVECAVMPADLPNAEPLLGLSFLKHFNFKIDNSQGKLVMSRVDQVEKGGRRPAGQPGPREKSEETSDGKERLTVDEQIVQLVKTDGEPPRGGLTLQSSQGPVKFLPCKELPIESLNKRFGAPDEMVKLSLQRTEGGEEKQLRWKLWTWGKVRILVDENGKTQLYSVAEK
jgi:clan AA aspartic protease (TIGR02281 family)